MKILMLTNTYVPHVGGVARSVSGLVTGLRRQGHGVLVAAPEFTGAPTQERDVVRVAALQHFAGSDFSMPLPVTWPLGERVEAFAPDIVHTHHPFLLGDTALRIAATYQVPIVFTYHTRYELYDHYVAQDSPRLKRLVEELAHGYCDLCDHVIAPSQSIEQHLRQAGVRAPITVLPTGIDIAAFASGNGERARQRWGLPPDAFVAGHVGRLAPEKNLDVLSRALIALLSGVPGAFALITGDGGHRARMVEAFSQAGLEHRVRFTGVLTGQDLWDVYAAHDVFAFSSVSETQGLVLAEAMAAGVPVVALDAPGVREVVENRVNGRLLPEVMGASGLASALIDIAAQPIDRLRAYQSEACRTAGEYSSQSCLGCMVNLYTDVLAARRDKQISETSSWQAARDRLEREIDIVSNYVHAVGDAVLLPEAAATSAGPKL